MENIQSKTQYSGIAGKTVVVTGAAAGIGFSLSKAFAEQGAKVFMIDLNETALTEATDALKAYQVCGYAANVTDDEAVRAAFERCKNHFGLVDVLFNNAGISLNKPSLEISMAEWRRCVDINLSSLFLCSQEAAKQMQLHGRGAIINTASIWGLNTSAERTAYCTTKAGVVAMTKCLAAEWGAFGIRVLAIGPGYTRTALVEKLQQQNTLDVADLERRTPLNRLAEPEEIAELGLFLASDAAKFMTGQTYLIDGGWDANGFQ
ncbi:short-chain dehydrogenase [Acinetobacter sp. ANC 4558]|uniref:SDR family NAD(P)-dependent oxidoreductase n=1 Tax=Acinetobacter sp. ANC 4558 TaxID=1977876 RepID=UPI000A32C07D|nr:SDR family NAD(P)-dependent oxidoreductase [Acinetobacter sp. ANC 4558]OTG88289.1 short-chain dehydrogenase [Acinetobacter sp. ANC 4558]